MVRSKGIVGAGVLALAALIFLAGCSGQPLTTREKGTAVGGVLGAGTGAIIGAAIGAPGAGAAIGGALGLAGGALNRQRLAESGDATGRDRFPDSAATAGNRAAAPGDRSVEAAERDRVVPAHRPGHANRSKDHGLKPATAPAETCHIKDWGSAELMRDAIEYADRNRVTQVRLVQETFNTPAISLYASPGFDIKGRTRLHAGRPGRERGFHGASADRCECRRSRPALSENLRALPAPATRISRRRRFLVRLPSAWRRGSGSGRGQSTSG